MKRPTPHIATLLFASLLASLLTCLLPGCGDRTPTRTTPEGTIAAARYVVEQRRADRLATFIYAESPEYRELFTRLGVLLRNAQRLGEVVQEKFPKEIAELSAKAEATAKSGKASGLLSQLSSAMNQNQRGRKRATVAERDAQQEALRAAVGRLFADPYAFLRESEERLTTTFLTDDSVALLWDKQPILPPIGVVLKKDADGLWYLLLPTNLPGVNGFMPKTKEQFQTFGSIIAVINNVVVDLRKDVEQGRVKTLDDLSRRAGEQAFMPAALAFYAYNSMRQAQTPPNK